MNYTTLEHHLSPPRLGRFLTAAGNSPTKACRLYEANLAVSKAFYPVLNLFEIVLRNAFNKRLSLYFSDPDWIINEKSGFMNDGVLAPSSYYLKEAVDKAEKTIRRKGGVITPGKIVAEQTLGFWTSLFDPHHYRLTQGTLIGSFRYKPAPINRHAISLILNRVRDFRNRVYHNEPICFNGSQIDFAIAVQTKADIYDLLSWMDPDLPGYVGRFDTSALEITLAKAI